MDVLCKQVEIVTVNGSVVSCTSDDDKSITSSKSGQSEVVSDIVSKENDGNSREEVTCLESLKSDDSVIGSEENSPSRFSLFIRGSDPRIATCRGKLQNKRSKLNQEINKELRLRAGAENLFKATTNKKLKETVALELSFVNSNLQLLKEQLAELNSSVELYQNEVTEPVIPMIPLGLKETKQIDFREPFKDFILEHYSEDANQYDEAINDLMDLRQAMRTPLRDLTGISLLFQYYNQLYFVDRRFFPSDRSLGIFFEWYDSLTGVPSCQRTVAFEKASVLFNIAAVYTQIAAKQDRMTRQGLDDAIDNFLRAAGVFKYICDNFTNAPSMDLNSEMLDMLGKLMMAHAKECLLEKLDLDTADDRSLDVSLELSQEASHVADTYRSVLKFAHPVRDYIPYSWIALMSVKQEYYAALSHRHLALGLLDITWSKIMDHTMDTLKHIHRDPDPKTQLDINAPKDDEERILLGRAHLRESLLRFEEAQRHHRMCRDLKNKPGLEIVLRQNQALAMDAFSATENENDFREVLDPPPIFPLSKFQLSPTPPDFSAHRVQDLFSQLGPCAIFSAKHYWTAPRIVRLLRMDNEDFGFTIRGGSPAAIAGVDPKSLADYAGMKEGDLIVAIGDEDVKWSPHSDIVELIKQSRDRLTLKLVTPMDKTYSRGCKNNKKGSVSGSSSSSGVSSNNSWNGSHSIHSTLNSKNADGVNWTSERQLKKLTWNPFKKNSTSALDLLR